MEKVKRVSRRVMMDIYSEKHNMSKEEIHRILTEEEAFLTKQELAIKYDNPDIGSLPGWLTYEKLHDIITRNTNMLWSKYFRFWKGWLEKDEIFNELYVFSLEKAMKMDCENHLSVSMFNHGKRILQHRINRLKHPRVGIDFADVGIYNEDIDEESSFYVKQDNTYLTDLNLTDRQLEERDGNLELVDKIRRIPDKQVKTILIVTGYIVSNIKDLRYDYLQVLRSSDEKTKQALEELNKKIEPDYNEETKTYINKPRNVSIKDVIGVLLPNLTDIRQTDEKVSKTKQINETLQELMYYIQNNNMVAEF